MTVRIVDPNERLTKGPLKQEMLQASKFLYELTSGGKSLKLYDLVGAGEGVSRVLAEVPFNVDLRTSVCDAVEKTLKGRRNPERLIIDANPKDPSTKERVYYIREEIPDLM